MPPEWFDQADVAEKDPQVLIFPMFSVLMASG